MREFIGELAYLYFIAKCKKNAIFLQTRHPKFHIERYGQKMKIIWNSFQSDVITYGIYFLDGQGAR